MGCRYSGCWVRLPLPPAGWKVTWQLSVEVKLETHIETVDQEIWGKQVVLRVYGYLTTNPSIKHHHICISSDHAITVLLKSDKETTFHTFSQVRVPVKLWLTWTTAIMVISLGTTSLPCHLTSEHGDRTALQMWNEIHCAQLTSSVLAQRHHKKEKNAFQMNREGKILSGLRYE